MPATSTLIGGLLGLGTQMYSNALRKLPYMRHPWEHVLGIGLGVIFVNQLVKWDDKLKEDLDKMLDRARAANERRYFGLQRCGKSCRLRWINYLRPDLKRGTFTAQEERVIIDVHRILGNRWAQIAKHLPGRTDNEVKNFWNSCIKKKLMAQGLDPKTHNLIPATRTSNNNNNVSNFSQFNHAQPSATVPFTISSNIKSFDTTKSNCNSMDILQQPFETLPPPLHDSLPMLSAFDQYQDANVLMGFRDHNAQNSLDYNSSLDHANILPAFDNSDFLDEACMWDGNAVGPLEATKQNGLEQQRQCQTLQGDGINEGRGLEMEMSYNSLPFDQLERERDGAIAMGLLVFYARLILPTIFFSNFLISMFFFLKGNN